MIGSWLYGYRSIEEELERIEMERNISLAKSNNISIEDMIKSETNEINKKFHGIKSYTAPIGNGTYPLDIISKYRNSYRVAAPGVLYYNNDPKKYGDGRNIPLWKGGIPDSTGKKPETMKYVMYQIINPISNRSKLLSAFPQYPEYYLTVQVLFNSLIVPIIKYIKSLGWDYQISSSARTRNKDAEAAEDIRNLISRYNTKLTGSDHNKAAAFDIIVTPKNGISPKAANAFLYKQIIFRQIPNLPNIENYIRQVLLEFNENSTLGESLSRTGWVHIAGCRFKGDTSDNGIFRVMCQGSGRKDDGLLTGRKPANLGFDSGKDIKKVQEYFNGSAAFKYYLAGTNISGYLSHANKRYSEFIQINRMHS